MVYFLEGGKLDGITLKDAFVGILLPFLVHIFLIDIDNIQVLNDLLVFLISKVIP